MKSATTYPLHELLNTTLFAVKRWISANPRRAVGSYLVSLFIVALAYLAATPIGSGDTDLWYHMNGGRLLATQGDLPDTAFFSFTETMHEWVNYFWGFQALTFQLFDHGGYPGLILLRMLLVGVSILAIMGLLSRLDDHPTRRAWALVLLVLVLLVLMGRTTLIRPHLVSYMMIPLFILVFERRQRWLPALPVLTVLWVNMHGVEWVVGAAICGAYFLENLWNWRKTEGVPQKTAIKHMGWSLACLPALFINPFGSGVLIAPFSTPSDVYDYIAELSTVPIEAFLSPSIIGTEVSISSSISLLFVGNLLAYGALLLKARLRIAPLLLSIVGMILLARGQRFIWEWVLLSLPLWRSAIDAIGVRRRRVRDARVHVVDFALAFLLLAPALSWFVHAKDTQQWPVNRDRLPVGVTQFLIDNNVSGKMLSPPDSGGYLAWRLYPKILISGDMQSPPTTPWSHFRVESALTYEQALQRFVDEYRPELIAVEFDRKGFKKLIASQADYRPIFFDDRYALYAHRELLPDLVRENELKYVNPHNMLDGKSTDVDKRLAELERVNAQTPGGDRLQHIVTRLLIDAKRYEEALPAARTFLDAHPENTNAHFLVGNVLEYLDRCDEAMTHFEDALKIAPESFKPVLHQHLGSCSYVVKDFAAAYRHFREGINTYGQQVEPQHRFQYALSAFAVGEDEWARTLLQHLLYVVDPEDRESIDKAKALLADLPEMEDDNPWN